MKKFLLLSMAASAAFSQFQIVNVTPQNINDYEQIVDIRTEPEWRATGIVKGAKTITFDPYNTTKFIQELKDNFDISKPIALICRSGNRSFHAARMLDSGGLNIINLNGGMGALIRQGYEPVPFNK
ncbi:rhodanese-like domain-containing protein [Campylobacter sp. RM16190]|uniref:rhodanese-like domain-containing protein n=1 Tax=Campylobacter sp. RM16190 TaxID=1705727 RepID=UPI001475996B|nr:rhodanese-like domain-containing protein [Campylobacter sp. RM16190]